MEPLARDAHWRSSYGVSYPVFASLVEHLKPILISNYGDSRSPFDNIPIDYAVAIVLSRLSHGHSRLVLSRRHSLPPDVVSKLTNAVTRLLSTQLYSDFIKIPSGNRLLHLLSAFKHLSSLPNLAGSLVSSQIPLSHRRTSASHRNSPPSPSALLLLLQAVADHRYLFWDVCVRASVPTEPAAHLRDSHLYHRLTSSEILRESSVSVRGLHVRPYLVADPSFPLLSFLLTPFSSSPSSSSLAPAQLAFNAALARARSTVEHAVALLKARWRILHNLNVGLSHAPQTIVACCVLHNFCQIAGEPEPHLSREEPVDTGESSPARALESEKSFFQYGESLRQALADDLYERQQRLLSR